jgi:CDP-diacylglycerol--glycerol-3-phosphate 3-phosphatidyltransferase
MPMLKLRPAAGRVVAPLASWLLRVGVTPDAVTVTGTTVAVVGAFAFFPRGSFFLGTVVVTLAVLTDALDGAMARMRGESGRWGAFLDSTMDRIADAAIFSAVVLWYAGDGDDSVLLCVTLFCLVSGVVTSYAKARAEGLGMTCNVGIAERVERLLAVLVGTGLTGLGLDPALPVLLWVLAVASAITVGQRLVEVHRQSSGQSATAS